MLKCIVQGGFLKSNVYKYYFVIYQTERQSRRPNHLKGDPSALKQEINNSV